MKRRFVPLASALVVFCAVVATAAGIERREEGNLVIEGIPDIPGRIVERMRQYNNTRSAGLIDWDAEGSGLYVSTRFGETSQIHYVARAGGARSQLTFFDEPVSGAAVCPDPFRPGFLFAKDVGGGENYQIFRFDRQTGVSTMLTDGESRNGGQVWSNRGDRFAFYSTKRNGRDWDILVASPDSPEEARPVVAEGGVWYPVEWSPDDTRLIVGRYVSANESYAYVLDVESGALAAIAPSTGPVAFGNAVWSQDGDAVFFSSDEETEFKKLRRWDVAAERSTVITGDIDWDVEGLAISPAAGMIAFTANEDGIDQLYLLDTETLARERIDEAPTGLIGRLRFDPAGERLAFTVYEATSPGDVFVLRIADRSIERWTESEVGGLDTGRFVSPELVRYPTFDETNGARRTIPAFYYRPEGEGPFPVVVDIHGGPEGQERPRFDPRVQYLANELGIAVLAPNVRGSSGYGKTYLALDNGFKREDSVRDIGALLDWIEARPELDASRVCVMGGSYGGYMVYAAMEHYNDRLRAGIDVVGISNFVTFLENTREYRRDLRRVEYGDERDPEMRAFLEKISPTTNAHLITKPMLIVQGLNDPRVPASEAEQMLAAIRANGGEAWYLLARDEGHGFRKKTNRDRYVHSVILFLETWMLD
ncbi:MAG: S9 family peptidase [Candidatus Krumholzibacteriota bacterium]|nr:S9 family peptidase [Candidatus Krumholzibacteriota bacterium]